MSAPLLNLASKTLNADGSTTVFGGSGNALETLEADGTSLVYAEPGYQTANVSVDDFKIVRDNLAGGNRNTIDRLIPHLMSTDLPLARVGLSESEARHQGIQVSERCLD